MCLQRQQLIVVIKSLNTLIMSMNVRVVKKGPSEGTDFTLSELYLQWMRHKQKQNVPKLSYRK